MFFHGKLKISLTKMSVIVENDERIIRVASLACNNASTACFRL